MSASVTYKDEIITTVKNTSKDLLTSGKYLEDDITITDITSLQAKSNISPTASSQTVSADAGYDGLSSVQINAIPSDYIGTDIPRRSSISVSQDNNTIHVEDGYYENDIDTSMGACTVTGANVLIDSQGDATGAIIVGRGGYINSGSHAFYVDDVVTPRSSSDLTASGATVSVPYGYYSADASKTVASGSAGTPTATKGSVSNHAVNVTPSVTNTTGYITGGTKTGTAVSVSASELVSGNKAITENGTGIDVANYSTVSVDVQGGSPAISVVDTPDSGGGTVRTITALDISDTTATAEDVASGKYFYTAGGVKTEGTSSGGGTSGFDLLDDITISQAVRSYQIDFQNTWYSYDRILLYINGQFVGGSDWLYWNVNEASLNSGIYSGNISSFDFMYEVISVPLSGNAVKVDVLVANGQASNHYSIIGNKSDFTSMDAVSYFWFSGYSKNLAIGTKIKIYGVKYANL